MARKIYYDEDSYVRLADKWSYHMEHVGRHQVFLEPDV